ncbi:Lipase_3 domain-containing protein [Durusdinium trenchii]|uniref:Lipase_3 domain-containing protein n=1 Tax=Durusdinium trenchii TaxID=1381693 RepID=A0ABP0KCC8_9DINO
MANYHWRVAGYWLPHFGIHLQVKAEMMASQMQQTVVDRKLRRADAEEKEQMALAKTTWEKLHLAEVAASNQEQSLRQVRRTAEKEEECEADVLGLLEFRECEMRQVELSLGEADTASPPSTSDPTPVWHALSSCVALLMLPSCGCS